VSTETLRPSGGRGLRERRVVGVAAVVAAAERPRVGRIEPGYGSTGRRPRPSRPPTWAWTPRPCAAPSTDSTGPDFVQRTPSDADRRAVLVGSTKQGERLREELAAIRADLEERLFRSLGAQDRERLLSLLATVLADLGSEPIPATTAEQA